MASSTVAIDPFHPLIEDSSARWYLGQLPPAPSSAALQARAGRAQPLVRVGAAAPTPPAVLSRRPGAGPPSANVSPVRIGLSAGAASAERAIEQAEQAETEGFTSLWYPGAVAGDPLVQMALAGRATSRIELGTAVLQTYPCHPTLQASRIQSVASAVGPARDSRYRPIPPDGH